MILITGLQKVIGQQTVLDIEEIRVQSGEVCAVVGPVGSGKSALIDILLGRKKPTLGEVFIMGKPPGLDESRREIGILFPDDGLYLRQSVEQNLKFYTSLYSLPRQRLDEVLERVGLSDHQDVRVEKLPSGLARRLALGRTLLHDPSALVLCEPFTRCDEGSIALIQKIILAEKASGKAVLILASEPAYLKEVAETILLLGNGRITGRMDEEEDKNPGFPFKIPVRMEGKVVLLNPGEILYADASDGRTQIWTAAGALPTQYTLAELEERLGRSGFFRAHRSYLVNLQHVKEVIPYTRNTYSLCLNTPTETQIPLSKAAAAELREMLKF
jgi:ABC-2 type transport system ATP-binding protein